MLNREVLTYKRKRISSKSNSVHRVEATDSCSGSHTPILSKQPCIEAGPTSSNEQPCGYNLNIPQGRSLFTDCTQNCERSPQQLCPMSTIMEKSRSTEESAQQQREFGSDNLLLSTVDLDNGSSCKASTPAVHASSNKLSEAFQTDNSSGTTSNFESLPGFRREQSTEPGLVRRSDVCFVSAAETSCDLRSPDTTDSMIANLNEKADLTSNLRNAKGKFHVPWITFSRRVKRGKATNENLTDNNQKTENKQLFMDNSSDQATSRNSQIVTRTIAGSIHHEVPCNYQGTNLANQHLLPTQHDKRDVESLSKEVTAEPVAEEIGESLRVQNHKQQSASDNNRVLEDDSLRNCLSTAASNLEKADMSIAHKERNVAGSRELSIALSTSLCLNGTELTKTSSEAVPRKLAAPLRTTCSRNTELGRQFTEAAQKTTESVLSTSSCYPKLLHEATDGKSNGMEWLESLDRALGVSKRAKGQFGIVNEAAINCRQASKGNALTTSPINFFPGNSFDQVAKDVSREFIQGSTSTPERVFLSKSGGSVTRLQHRGKQKFSSLPTDFLGLSLPSNPEATSSSVKEVKSLRPVTSVNHNVIHGSDSLGQGLDEYSSLLRYQQPIDNMITYSTSRLNKFRRYSLDWTEDELDSLWIGVRRHGVDNWISMLKDPKLLFSENRVAADLAERWKIEQKKIFSATLAEHMLLNRSDPSPYAVLGDALTSKSTTGNYCGRYGDWSSEFKKRTAETRLSLGDVYVQKWNVPKRKTSPLPGLNTGDVHMCDGPSEVLAQIAGGISNDLYPSSGIRIRNSGKCHGIGYFSGQSSNEHHSNGIPASNIPHWLKEDVPTRSVLCDSELFKNDQHTLALFPGEPLAIQDSPGHGILKRRFPHGNKSRSAELPMAEALPFINSTQYENSTKPMQDNDDLDHTNTFDLNMKILGSRRSNGSVVIDNSASSEETISDRSEH